MYFLLPLLQNLKFYRIRIAFHVQLVWHANRGRLFLRAPGPFLYKTCICSYVERGESFHRSDITPNYGLLPAVHIKVVACHQGMLTPPDTLFCTMWYLHTLHIETSFSKQKNLSFLRIFELFNITPYFFSTFVHNMTHFFFYKILRNRNTSRGPNRNEHPRSVFHKIQETWN